MKKKIAGLFGALAMVGLLASPAAAERPACNWGRLTAAAVTSGFDQGPHASDPSGDGHGPGTADEPRAGLGNVVEQGNLTATCELISGLMP